MQPDDDFFGGTGWDTLNLGVGEYTVGRQHGFVTFTQGGTTMTTAEFELLRIGSEAYCFADLRNGDIVG
jgi:hypothetical protein